LPGAIHDQDLVPKEKRLRNWGTDAARSEQAGQGGDAVDEKNDQIVHRRIVAGRGILDEITIRQKQVIQRLMLPLVRHPAPDAQPRSRNQRFPDGLDPLVPFHVENDEVRVKLPVSPSPTERLCRPDNVGSIRST